MPESCQKLEAMQLPMISLIGKQLEYQRQQYQNKQTATCDRELLIGKKDERQYDEEQYKGCMEINHRNYLSEMERDSPDEHCQNQAITMYRFNCCEYRVKFK